MKYRIHFELPDESQDSVIVEADTVEECRQLAVAELERRDAYFPWSEEIK